nr:KNR4/SMI1 homolog isoform X2 [Nicotiana tomentosiformis]
MGACASKPKVLEGTAPGKVPAPELASNGNVADVAAEEGIVGDDKRQSLGNLFKKSEEGKDSEQVKEETSTIQASEPSEPQTEEVVTVLDTHITTDTTKASEVEVSKTETPDAKTSVEKATEEVKSETETPTEEKREEVKSEAETKIEEVKSETESTEASVEKKEEEVKEAVETPSEKKIEEDPVTQATKSEALVENKTEEKPATEAKKPVIEEKKSGKFWWDK